MVRMKVLSNRLVSFFVVVCFFTAIFGGAAVASAEEPQNIDINVGQDSLLDVALTLGQTDSDVSNIEEDLTAALVAKGVPEDKINITAVQASEVSAGNTSSGWKVYDHVTTTPWSSYTDFNYDSVPEPEGSTGSPYKHIWVYDEGQQIVFYGYYSPTYKDFMFMPNDDSTKKTFTFTMNDANINNHSMLGGGFIFNAYIDGLDNYAQVANLSSLSNHQSIVTSAALGSQTISGYALLLIKSGTGSYPALYKFTNVPMSTFHSTNAMTLVQSNSGDILSGVHSIKIEVSGSTFKMWDTVDDTTHTMEYDGLVDTGSYGFGPMAQYSSHSCYRLSWFNFENLQMTTTSAKKFSEVIRQPSWRDGSKRFVINAQDGAVDDFSDPVALGEILSRLGNENINYIGWGKDAEDGNAFIAKNDENGTFVDKTAGATDTYAKQIEAMAEYIYNQYTDSIVNDTEYLIYGVPNSLAVMPQSEQTNTADADWSSGKWKVVQDENYYENPTGVVPYNTQYLNNLDISFTETGKYELYYKDELVKTVYVHRKPVAGFSVILDAGLNVVDIPDNAYDPDYLSHLDKGIASETWKYKETGATDWTDGQPAVLEADKNYIIKQVVTDGYGVQSDPYYRYITTDSTVTSPPMAEFKVTPDRLLTYNGAEEVSYLDTSYDPGGGSIDDQLWTVLDGSGVPIYSGSTPMTDFEGIEAGTYKITLKVMNSGEVWSEEVARFLTVVRDTTDPTAESDTASGSFTTPQVIGLTFADETGGSGFKCRYTVVDSNAGLPESWGSMGTNVNYSVALEDVGTLYIHYKVEDYAGNETIGTFGPFTLSDNTPPSAPDITTDPSVDETDWSSVPVTASASGSTDDFTADGDIEYQVSTNGADYSAGISITLDTDGTHTVYFKALDESGNSSSASRVVKIDQTAPTTPNITMTSGGDPYTAGTWATANVTASINGATDATSGVSKYQYKIDSGDWTDGNSYVFNTSGKFTISFRSVDNAGNASTEDSREVWVDLEAPGEPTVNISPSYSTEWTNQTVTLTAQMSMDNMTEEGDIVYETSSNGTDFTAGNSVELTGEGEHTVYFRVTDSAGNKTTVSRTIKIDKTNPQTPDITMTSDSETYTEETWTGSAVDIELSGAADAGGSGLAKYQYKIDDGDWTDGTTHTFDTSGQYAITYRSADGAGNVSAEGSKNIWVDLEAPEDFGIETTVTTIDSIKIFAETADGLSGVAAYRVNDGSGWSDWKTAINETLTGYSRGQEVTVTVEAIDAAGNVQTAQTTAATLTNIAPVATDDGYTCSEDGPKTYLNLIANDSDRDMATSLGDSLRVSGVSALSDPKAGTLALEGSGAAFTPAANYYGMVTFTYTLADANGGKDTGSVTIVVTPVNDPPEVNNDSAVTDEDIPVAINVLQNDRDVDSSLSIDSYGQAGHGTVSRTGVQLLYTPGKNFNGTDSFTYTATDGAYKVSATVSVTVRSVNDAPVLKNDSASTSQNQTVAINVLANDSDPEGQTLSLTAVSAPKHGRATITAGQVVYTPSGEFIGSDTFTYAATDGAAKASATVTVQVSAARGEERLSAEFTPPSPGGEDNGDGENNDGGKDNDGGEDNGGGKGNDGGNGNGGGDGGNGPTGPMQIIDPPSGGTVTTSGGSAFYTPDEGYKGVDTYRVLVEENGNQVEYQVITYTDESGNTSTIGYGRPLSDGDFNIKMNTEVAIDLSELLGIKLTDGSEITISSLPVNGNARIENGQLIYTPADGYKGMDGIVITIDNGDEKIPFAAAIVVEEDEAFFSWMCLICWIIVAVALLINYLRRADYYDEKKLRVILYIAVSAAVMILLCWLRMHIGYVVPIIAAAAYVAANYLIGWRGQRAMGEADAKDES